MSVAIITGASSGIGEAVATELHRRGWKVGLIARREERLRGQVEALGDGAAFAVADVANADTLRAAVHQLEQTLGPCDLMLANAGIGDGHTAREFDMSRVMKVLEVNVHGVIHAIDAVLPGMVERGRGTIAATSSVAGFRGLPSFGPYSASKAYVSTLLEACRVDLRGTGVKVSTVHPGFVISELTDRNNFSMPFLVKTDKAARIIVNGLVKGKARIDFPWQMVCLMTFVKWVPNWLYDRLVGAASPTTPKKDTP